MQACCHFNGSQCELWSDDIHALDDSERYRRLIGKLIYLIVTTPDITFAIGVLSRFMHQSRETRWLVAISACLHQELSRKMVGVQKIWACTHF